MTAMPGSSHAAGSPEPDDERTVGDLLLDADTAARELLWDAPPDTAKAKARSWGEVVEAAADLWSSFPDRTGNPSMERIHKLTLGMHRTQQRTGWPGAGEGDPRLERVVENLSRATEMISARRHPTAPLSEPGHLDSEAARIRLMHVVYVASHGVGQALWQYNRDMRRVLDAKQRLNPGQSADQSINGHYQHHTPGRPQGGRAIPAVPGRVGEGARGTVREDLGYEEHRNEESRRRARR